MYDRFRWGVNFVERRLSIICWALSPNVLSAQSLSSSKKSDRDLVLWSNKNSCHLCLAVACDYGLTYFFRHSINISSRVF